MSESEVLKMVWDWRGRDKPPQNKHVQQRRRHALIECSVMVAVALILRLKFEKIILSSIIFSVACLVLVGGLFIPVLYAGFKRLGERLAMVLGVGVTWLLLAPFFYIFFTIARIGCVIAKKDPMCRRLEPELKSYWFEHSSESDVSQYRKQY
ncbi:MAG: hypothetical protein O3C57_07945 [Verrucomicrobia bacterium]|nr:hypothetical protein [Verrucomicrobiota bacterium]